MTDRRTQEPPAPQSAASRRRGPTIPISDRPQQVRDVLELGAGMGQLGFADWTDRVLQPFKYDAEVGSGLDLRNVKLDQADLSGKNLTRSDLSHASLRGANLRQANLRHSVLFRANLQPRHAEIGETFWDVPFTDLSGADLSGADLREANLLGARFRNAKLDGALFAGAQVDGHTVVRSGWSFSDLARLVKRGVLLGNMRPVPPDYFLSEQNRPGLTLTFDTRLHRFDPTAFDAFIGDVLGDTDVTIEERSNIGEGGPAFVRINGSDPEHLVAVAEAFYDRAWETAQSAAEEAALVKAMSSGFAMLLGRLSHQRDHLVRIEENVGILGNPDVQEMLTDQAEAHVTAKVAKATKLHGRFRRIADAVGAEAKKRGTKVIGEGVVDAVVEAAAETVDDAAKWKERRDVAGWQRVLDATEGANEPTLLEGPSDQPDAE